jgi:hypothetical protein
MAMKSFCNLELRHIMLSILSLLFVIEVFVLSLIYGIYVKECIWIYSKYNRMNFLINQLVMSHLSYNHFTT